MEDAGNIPHRTEGPCCLPRAGERNSTNGRALRKLRFWTAKRGARAVAAPRGHRCTMLRRRSSRVCCSRVRGWACASAGVSTADGLVQVGIAAGGWGSRVGTPYLVSRAASDAELAGSVRHEMQHKQTPGICTVEVSARSSPVWLQGCRSTSLVQRATLLC